MQKKFLAALLVFIFIWGLILTPNKIISAEPVIKIISDPVWYLDNINKSIIADSNSDSRDNSYSCGPVLTFPNGESTTIPRYINASPKATDIPDVQDTAVLPGGNTAVSSKSPVIISPKSQSQPVINVRAVSEADIGAQSMTPYKTNTEKNTEKNPEGNLEKADKKSDLPEVKSFRGIYNGSPAHALVGRAIWYMNYGYMVYGNKKYWDTGYIDCSNFVSLVYKDFGYNITSAARKYDTVGKPVSGVYSRLQAGSTKKYMLAGVDKLKPGDILTFWKEDSNGKRYIGHVAIYMGKLDGKPTIIHTVKGNPTAIGITTSFTYWYGEHFNDARRVLPTTAYSSKTAYTDNGPVTPAKYQMKLGPVIMPGYLLNGF